VQKIQKFRSILLVLFVAIGVALAGVMFIYLTVHAWQAGEFHSRGRIIRLSSNPIEFIFAMVLGGAFGVALLGSSPLIMLNAFKSDAAKNKFIADNSKIHGGVRPSIIWLLIALLVLVGYVLLLSLVHRL
jgi:hypothetical protein